MAAWLMLALRRWWGFGLLALALHALALWWAHGVWQPKSQIKLMPEPIYVRMLQPKEPATAPTRKQYAKAGENTAPARSIPQSAVQAVAQATKPITPPPPASPAPPLVPPAPPSAAPPPAIKTPAAPPQATKPNNPAKPKRKVYIPPPPKEAPLFKPMQDEGAPRLADSTPLLPPALDTLPEPAVPDMPGADSPAGVAPIVPPNMPPVSGAGDPVTQPAPPLQPLPSIVPSAAPLPSPAPAVVPLIPIKPPQIALEAYHFQDWPGDTRINMKVKGFYRGEINGSARVLWQRQQDNYQARVEVSFGLGGFTMTSQGKLTEEGLNPAIFEEKLFGKISTVKIDAETVTTGKGNRINRAARLGPLGVGTGTVLDSASQFVEMAHRFSSGRAVLAPGQTVRFWLGRPEGMFEYIFDVVGQETLHLRKLGPVSTYRLVPRPIPNLTKDAIRAEIWFAPSLQYLPVRILMKNDLGANLDLTVEDIEQGEKR